MLAFGIVLLGATLFAHGWWQAGVTETKATGWLAGATSLALAAAVLAPAAVFGAAGSVAVGTLLLTWAIYAFLLAGLCLLEHGTRETGTRTLGFYGIWFAIAHLFFLGWFITGSFSLAGVIVTALLAAAFILLFLQMAASIRVLGPFVAWVFIGVGIIVSLVGLFAILGFIS